MVNTLQEESDLILLKSISFTHLRDLAERIRSTIPINNRQVRYHLFPGVDNS